MIRIKELREEKSIGQKELGKLLNVAQNTTSNWENGSREPDSKALVKLAEILDCSTGYLLRESIVRTPIDTIAAHHDGDEFTEEELADIEKFKEFVKMNREQGKKE